MNRHGNDRSQRSTWRTQRSTWRRTSIVCSLEQSAAGSFAAARVRLLCPFGYYRLDHRQVGDRVALFGARLASVAPIR
jgi:hypothetical protein